jgi:hypothetical protein
MNEDENERKPGDIKNLEVDTIIKWRIFIRSSVLIKSEGRCSGRRR